MPPYRQYGGRAKYANKKRFRGLWRRRGTAVVNKYLKPTYNRIVKTVNKLKNVVNAEMKQFTSETSFAAGGSQVVCLNPIDQGDAHDDRDGLTVRQKYLHIRGTVTCDADVTTTIDRVRCSVVCKKNNQGATATYSQVYDINGSSYDWQAMRTYDGSRNYFVLKDQLFNVSNGQGVNLPRTRTFDWYIPLDMRTRWEYGQTGGGAADIQTNGLYFLVYDSQNAQDFATVQLSWRIGFYDN